MLFFMVVSKVQGDKLHQTEEAQTTLLFGHPLARLKLKLKSKYSKFWGVSITEHLVRHKLLPKLLLLLQYILSLS
jgi:hypothetical protein